MDKNILEKINQIFKEVLEHDGFQLSLTTTTKDIEGWESSTHMMIISEIEDQFNIEFELDELWTMKNIGDLVESVSLKTQ
ncbi:acyl carrier protein [Mariniflexile sp.]|uniref:acyl carrier protein n=1 Tax=Mariniflexile sp. TaxID=1979402 RepID=UPI0040478F62